MDLDLGIYTVIILLFLTMFFQVWHFPGKVPRKEAGPGQKHVDPSAGQDNREGSLIAQLANRIIEDAHLSGADDVFIEPLESAVLVRYRINRRCQEKLRIEKKAGPELIARLKIMSNLDLAQHQLPQEGQIDFPRFTKRNLDLDLRVIITPGYHGEGAAIRIFNRRKAAAT